METAPRDISGAVQSSFKKYRPFIMGAVLVLVAAGVLYFVYSWWSGNQSEALPEGYERYTEAQTVFGEASRLADGGDLDGAQITYNQLLIQTDDPIVEERTMLQMARATAGSDPVGAIEIYKGIVADEIFDPHIKAAALTEMGLLYTTYPASDRTEVTEAIFTTDEPYDSLRDEGDVIQGHINLFEYANNVDPHILAAGYAGYLRVLKDAPGDDDRTASRKLLEQLAADLEATVDTNPNKSLATILLASSVILLEAHGEEVGTEGVPAELASRAFELNDINREVAWSHNLLWSVYLNALAIEGVSQEQVSLGTDAFVDYLLGDDRGRQLLDYFQNASELPSVIATLADKSTLLADVLADDD